MSLRAFNASLNRFMESVPEQANLVKRKVALQVLEGVVDRTPVDTGRARGAWQVELNGPAAGVRDLDANGGSTITAGAARIEGAEPGDDIHVTNNVPYIRRLEHGHSRQAPGGMVEATLADVGGQFA